MPPPTLNSEEPNNAVQYEDGNAPQVGSDSGANNVVSKDN